MKTRVLFFLMATVVCAVFTPSTLLAQNLLVNPGFEDPITWDDEPPFIGRWVVFLGVSGALAGNSSTMPRSGDQSLELSISDEPYTFAGVYQDVGGLTAGLEYTYTGFHAAPSIDPPGVEIRIEWRDSVSDAEIASTPNLTPIPTASYSSFCITAIVPAGADQARLFYAIETFSNPVYSGIVYVDDLSFGVSPLEVSIIVDSVLDNRGRIRSDICWNTISNQTYQVQYSSDVGSSNWFNLGSPVRGNGATNCVSDRTQASTRFYRVINTQ